MTGTFHRWKAFVARRRWIPGNCHTSVFACLCRAVELRIPLCNELIDEIDAHVVPVKGDAYWQPEIEYENAMRAVTGDPRPRPRKILKVSDHDARKQGQWPEADRTEIERVCAAGLKQRAALHWEFVNIKQANVIKEIFKPTEFICIGTKFVCPSNDKAWFDIQTSRADRTMAGTLRSASHIVPNPFSAALGVTKSGKPTVKSNSQVLKRRFLVIEIDWRAFSWAEDWTFQQRIDAALLIHRHLMIHWPLVLLVYSGNESIHGWYPTHNASEGYLHSFMEYCVRLGADSMMWCPSQFARMPSGLNRQTGKRQSVIYHDPSKIVF
jgi:hypothetical protein